MPPIEKITAPYNFVPLSEHIFFPDWGPRASQDWPFEDGVCGTFDIRVEALSPVFIRGEKAPNNGPWQFFKTPDNKFAIPGTSLRGMLRNVLQVASFGRFAPANDHRYGFRDLNNEEYRRPLDAVRAGWLRKAEEGDSSVATIEPCKFAKVHYDLLMNTYPGFVPGNRQVAADKYRYFEAPGRTRSVNVTLDQGELRVTQMLGPTLGELVFTGQPMDWNRQDGRKHHDFVFIENTTPPPAMLAVSGPAFNDFEFIHSDRRQQRRSTSAPNEEWSYWKPRFENGERIPVFYLLKEDGRIRSFGLAMMFRLAYKMSVGGLANRLQAKRNDHAQLDLAETMFGRVGQGIDEGSSLKGRVSVGLLTAEGVPVPCRSVQAILAAPKASFYPSYLEQFEPMPAIRGQVSLNTSGNLPDGGKYRTYQDHTARPRGWKRYRPQAVWTQPANAGNDAVVTTFQPLPAGTAFCGRIRVHNLRKFELGALLWALDFGRDAGREHMLGMGRPLGYGRVKVAVLSSSLAANDPSAKLPPNFLVRCREKFAEDMGTWATRKRIPGGWAGSVQVAQLLACARILGGTDGHYMALDDFAEAKRRRMVLSPAAAWTGTLPNPTVTMAVLTLNPGTQRWEGRAQIDGRDVQVTGQHGQVIGLNEADRTRRRKLNALCEVREAGGNAFTLIAVKN